MPIYEYICTKCGHEFDEIQKFSDPPLKKCPKCKGKLEKKMSAPSFQLKGTGWYATDFKDKPKAPANTPPKTPEVKNENKSETNPAPVTKPESKSEGKTENKKTKPQRLE